MSSSSKIFSGYRALGYVSNDIPISLRYHKKRKKNYVTASVGFSFHVYDCTNLGLAVVGLPQPSEISALAQDDLRFFVASGNIVQALDVRGKKVVHVYKGHSQDVHLILPFGAHMISVDKSSHVKIWDISSEEEYLELPFDVESFEISSIMHPYTYKNKVLLGSCQGSLQLWDIKKSQLMYTFSGWASKVCVIEQAPALDVVAIGLENGSIVIHNIKFDETIVKFQQDWGPVTALSFRTDGPAIMCSGSACGHVALWDLDDQKLMTQMRDVHAGPVSSLICFSSEPLMVTASSDNSIKMWVFDEPDGRGRLLRQRSGHSLPPTKIRFHGEDGKDILSAGEDRHLRTFSLLHDNLNKDFGRGSFNKKLSKRLGSKKDTTVMPPIIDLASESAHESDWDNIVACHRGLSVVTTWSHQMGGMGEKKLDFQKPAHTQTCEALCVTLTFCGNFTVIGYSSGHVIRFNIQSGILRATYGEPAHSAPVRGVCVDALNQLVISGGGDRRVRFWHFKSQKLVSELELESQVSKMYLHRDSNMLAVALDNSEVHVADVDTRRVVRMFIGHQRNITDMSFSPDGRWLITASMDTTIRIWDMPTATLIDCFCVESPITSLAVSPNGELLATTHVEDLGVYLWTNNTLYRHVALRPLPMDYEPRLMNLPTTGVDRTGEEDKVELMEVEEEETDTDITAPYKSPEQLNEDLVTLAQLPTSRWLNLLSLDVIKKRNKPREPPKVHKSAPFFIPTVPGLEMKLAPVEDEQSQTMDSHVLELAHQPLSQFAQHLQKSHQQQDYLAVVERLKGLGPSAIDVELRCLSPDNGGSLLLMLAFLKCCEASLKTNRDFEVVQAYLGLFLKLHAEEIAENAELVQTLKSVQAVQVDSWTTLEDHFNQNMCLVNFLKSAVLS